MHSLSANPLSSLNTVNKINNNNLNGSSNSDRNVESPHHGDSGNKVIMIGETVPTTEKSNVKRKLLKSEAEKILKEQLSRGKLPPKAKFRADDEISIGEPAATAVPRRVSEPARSADRPLTVEDRVDSPSVGGGSVNGESAGSSSEVGSAQLLLPATVGGRSTSKPATASYKSASLDNYYRSEPAKPKPLKSSTSNLFQRINSLRQSFSERRAPSRITPHTTSADSGFFQGIEYGTRKPSLPRPYEIRHGSFLVVPPLCQLPKAPPKRKRPRRVAPPTDGGGEQTKRALSINGGLKRSLSFTDAQFIAQAVAEGDNKLIEETYPNFPLSQQVVYTVIKKAEKRLKDGCGVQADKMVKPSFPGFMEHSLVNRDESKKPPTVINIQHISRTLGESTPVRTLPGSNSSTPVRIIRSPVHQEPVSPSLQQPSTPGINFYSPQEPSPIISPWARSSTATLRSSTSTVTNNSTENNGNTSTVNIARPSAAPTTVTCSPDNVVLVEVDDNNTTPRIDVNRNKENIETTASSGFGISANHPFIQRVQNQDSRSNLLQDNKTSLFQEPGLYSRNGAVSVSSLSANSQLSFSTNASINSNLVQSPGSPFRKILSLADSNLNQAESLLSTLGCQRSGLHESEDDSDPPSLGSDIESNIRKLERTQAKINAALETFRLAHHSARGGSPRCASTIDNAELFSGRPAGLSNRRDSNHRVTYPQSTSEITASPPKAEFNREEPLPELKPVRKTSLFRRHSFNQSFKEKGNSSEQQARLTDSNRDSSVWGESDIDSARSSAIYDDSAFSDSEGGFSPLKNRIRGLLGSFGKGKKKLNKSPKKRETLVIMKDPMDTSSEMSESMSIGQFTELVKSLPANNFKEGQQSTVSSPAFLRPKNPRPHKAVVHNNSNETYSSVSTNQSFNISSNRNSVISAQSISSESYDNDNQSNNSQSDENGTVSTSSPQAGCNLEDMSPAQRQERKLFFIAREIMTSERVYVDVLRLLNTEFREFVQKARSESKSGILPDQDFVKLFSNLPELMMLNEDLLRDFEERVENWSKVKKIADVIVRKGPYLKLYTVFIRDFSAMNFHFEECCTRFPKFGKLVKEFEKMPRCQHLKLQHYMLKPVQRLPQYKLLLEDYLKHLDPDSPDFDDTTQALNIVSEAAEHANNTVKQGDKFQRMLRLQSRLGDWELIKPGRELIKEGELHKISRKGFGSRYFILVSDCLLYTSYQGAWAGDSTTLKVSYAIMLNQLQVSLPPCQDREYSTEFSITSNVRSCTLRAKDVKERNDWLEALNTAIEEYRSRKATFVSSDLAGAPANKAIDVLGDSAPVWIPDQRVTMCQACGSEFNLVQRRHHCRGCGRVVCTTCSRNKAPLRYKGWESHRVCDTCFDFLEKQYGEDDDLRSRFKKRETQRAVQKYIPTRLKLSANDEGSQMSGHLRRRTKNSKWKRWWFVLKDRVLYTYKASEDTVAVETLPVLGWNLEPLTEAEDNQDVPPQQQFALTHPGIQTFIFAAESVSLAERWLAELKLAVTL